MHNLSHSVRKRLTRHLATFPHIKQTSDATFILDPRNWIDNRIISDVPFEAEQMAFVKRRVRELGISQVIDIGANFGLYTITLGKMPEIQSVIAFEPVNRNFNQLCGNVFANRLDSKVTAHRCALGASDATETIHIDPKSTGVARLDLATSHRNAAVFSESEAIQIRRGDDLLSRPESAVFMKIDVEGHGAEVLKGLERFLASSHGLIQIETDSDDAETFDILDHHHWHFSHRIGGDNYFEKPI